MRQIEIDIPKRGIHTLIFPQLEDDILTQISEIFGIQHYKLGKVKDGIILDVGANIGLATLYFQDTAKQIYSFEPNPELYKALVYNTKDFKNVKTFNVGISLVESDETMYSDGRDGDVPQTLFPIKGAKSRCKVHCVPLNQFMEQNGIKHADTLKIDVEGAEYAIFPCEDFKEAAKKIDRIVGEAHYNPNGGFPELIGVILADYGFKTRFLKLKKPNMIRKLDFNWAGIKKTYRYGSNTIFYAEKS